MNAKGSNQYKTKKKHNYIVGWACAAYLVYLGFGFTAQVLNQNITSPCQNYDKCSEKVQVLVKTVYAKEETSELQDITNYIVKKFQPEGRGVATRALACFISESGLNPQAYNFNTNGTGDYSIAQVNSIHVQRFGSDFMYDWKKNIDTAYQIYKERGFSAWYGKGCK